jgi:hypothetical protein
MKTSVVVSLVVVVLSSPSAWAQGWAQKMFPENRHDFGSVARSAKAEYEFTFTNPYLEEVRIAGVRASCGCTTPYVKNDKRTLKTHETGAIVAKINSDTFLGVRGATITVTFDKPFYAEAQLHVAVQIRDDVVVQPGSVHFGEIAQGAPVARRLTVSTPGRADLQIVGVRSPNPHITAKVAHTAHRAYDLNVQLSEEAPAGYVDENLQLLTNDPRLQFSVRVEGLVRPSLTVSPSWLLVGVVGPGERATRQVVVRGDTPFAIRRIIPAAGFECNISNAQQPRALHVVPVTFTASAKAGKVLQTLRIETDTPGKTVDFVVQAIVQASPEVVAAEHRQP